MKDTILNNIKAVLKALNYTEKELANNIGISQQALNNQLRGRNAVTLDTVLGVLTTYDVISADWLLLGKGSMFGGKEVIKNENTLHATSIKESNLNLGGTQTINGGDQAEKIKELEERNKKLEKQVDDLIAVLAK